MRRERENEREGEQMMLEWSMLKKMWKKKKENVSSMSSQKKAKDLQWCKYSVMKRRTESLLDLAERKGALGQRFKTRPQERKER